MTFIVGLNDLLVDAEKELGIKFDTTCAFSKVYGYIAQYTGKMGKKCGELEQRAIQLCRDLQVLTDESG